MHGRLRGKKDRNTRALETAAGFDVVMDGGTPRTILLSSFDPVRGEYLIDPLQQLSQDRSIHPDRMEVVAGIKRNTGKKFVDTGECSAIGEQNA